MEKVEEEYLTIAQVAFLLGRNRQYAEKLVSIGHLHLIAQEQKYLVSSEELIRYISIQLQKYANAISFLDAEDTILWWEERPHVGKNSMHRELLTVSQTAYLLGISRQAVYNLLNDNKIEAVTVKEQKREGIRVVKNSFAHYLLKKLNRFRNALLYLQSEDTFGFWQSKEQEFKEFMEKERSLWRGKISKRASETSRKRTRTGQTQGKIPNYGGCSDC